MDIRNSLDGLKSLLGVTQPSASPAQTKGTTAATTSALNSDRAAVSSVGSEVLSALADSDVRTGKVAEVRAALAAGTYNVPPSAVASKMVDSMLGGVIRADEPGHGAKAVDARIESCERRSGDPRGGGRRFTDAGAAGRKPAGGIGIGL